VDIFLIAFLIRNANEYNRRLNSLPVLLTNPSTYFEKPFKAADPAAFFTAYFFLFHQQQQGQAMLLYLLNFLYRLQRSFLEYAA